MSDELPSEKIRVISRKRRSAGSERRSTPSDSVCRSCRRDCPLPDRQEQQCAEQAGHKGDQERRPQIVVHRRHEQQRQQRAETAPMLSALR